MWNEIIEKKRLEMIIFADKYGFTDDKTVQCSQELDKLLNAIQFMDDIEE